MRKGVHSCSGVEVYVEVVVPLRDKARAQALVEALRPDDKTAPPGITIEENVDDEGNLVISVRGCVDSKKLGTIRNTVDEIVEFMYAALKVIEASSTPGKRY